MGKEGYNAIKLGKRIELCRREIRQRPDSRNDESRPKSSSGTEKYFRDKFQVQNEKSHETTH